jgi:hypothetical protein
MFYDTIQRVEASLLFSIQLNSVVVFYTSRLVGTGIKRLTFGNPPFRITIE